MPFQWKLPLFKGLAVRCYWKKALLTFSHYSVQAFLEARLASARHFGSDSLFRVHPGLFLTWVPTSCSFLHFSPCRAVSVQWFLWIIRYCFFFFLPVIPWVNTKRVQMYQWNVYCYLSRWVRNRWGKVLLFFFSKNKTKT
jgi:hypothetical protein